ncbi:MAG: hypothetical protein PHX05_01190 [Acidobacteriota bacterium]|nr:hypothetical protein [Acidobacteriota bacterium]
MKKKEKEHLKADPFVHFMQQALAFFKSYRRPLLIGAGVVALAAVILLAVFLFNNMSSSGENRRYAEAFRIQHDEKMGVEQKIAALQGMKFGRGISAAGHLFLAALYYQKGDLQKAETVLAAMAKSRVALVNDEKHALLAQVLAAGGKGAEARGELERLLANKNTAMAKELVLMQLAKLNIRDKRNDEAIATLKRILAEFAETPSAVEARALVSTMETSAAAR